MASAVPGASPSTACTGPTEARDTQSRDALGLLESAAGHSACKQVAIAGLVRINAPLVLRRLQVVPPMVDLQSGIHLVLPKSRFRSRKAQVAADCQLEPVGTPPYRDIDEVK